MKSAVTIAVTGSLFLCLFFWLINFNVLTLVLFIAGALTALLFVLRPKAAAGASIVVVLFAPSIEQVSHVSAVGFADEAAVILSALLFPTLRILSRQGLRWVPGLGWIALCLVMGLLSGLVNDVSLGLNVQGAFLLVKGVLFAFGLAQLNWETADLERAAKVGGVVLAFVLITVLINLAVPGPWTEIFGRMRGGIQYRLGLPSVIGPFTHPVALGQVLALATSAVLAFRLVVHKGIWSQVLLWGSLLGGLLSLRRKVLIALGASLLAVRMSLPGRRLSTGLAILVLSPLALVVSFDALATIVDFTYQEYVINGGVQARAIFYRDSAAIGVDRFPFGAGFSRFGSYLASTNYSPEYVERGYQSIWGLGQGETGGFLVDTFWPSVLGEAGFLGLIGFVFALLAIFRMASRVAKSSDDVYVKWAGIVLVAWSVEFAIESVAAPVYNSPPTFILFFGLAGIVASFPCGRRSSSELLRRNGFAAKMPARDGQQRR